jgi:hypothetical protein
LWRQFGAAIDMLEDAIRLCPDELWAEPIWTVVTDEGRPQQTGEFWSVAYHALFYLDVYLSGGVEQLEAGFSPPAPFSADPPARRYTRAELLSYLGHGRAKCRATLEDLTDEGARRPCEYDGGIPFAEMLLVNMRHVQQHAEHLSVFVSQRTGRSPDWVDKVRGG